MNAIALANNTSSTDLSVEQARQHIASMLPTPRGAVERLALRDALGRVLAQDVVSTVNVPAQDNSAMDGYALRGADLPAEGPATLPVAGVGLAGQPHRGAVAAGHCVRITTGAVLPDGLDTVIPQELVTRQGDDHIVIPVGAVRAGDNRRRAGEDLALGSVAVSAGRVLRPADIGLLASLGQVEVPVHRRLRVAFFSTGDELRSLGDTLDEGCVYDSNRYTLWAMLTRLGVEPLDLGVVRDDPDALREALRTATHDADVLLTSGGVSVGEADHTRRVMTEMGDMLFWRIAMRPGRPLAVGRLLRSDGSACMLFGLPGNPVAVMVTFYAFVRDALLAMTGAREGPLPRLRCRAATALRKRPGRTEFVRVQVSRHEDGHWEARPAGAQGSGVLRSMSLANGLLELTHDQGDVAAGDWVDVVPFDGLV